ncbi:MAG: tRNA lysidine(34) synthetase TilS [Verrucomicrobiales bacterium]|jgi:tRNA(Ile)-lysidine synthase|nr:tRNA lysidine(34) synthetase TilS [Verrucomicrobiales bacterium]
MVKGHNIADLERRALAAVARACPPTVPAAVAVSGGVDSLTLAEALRRLGRAPLCLHVNHGWRGRASDGDEQFVRAWCRARGLALTVKRLPARTPRTEAAARAARLTFFRQALRRRKLRSLLLAHHADDLVETFFLQLLRGAGPAGLAALTVRRELDGVEMVRPLLAFTKRELERLARHWRLTWREDATNGSEDYLRNRVRRRLLPYLRKLSGRDPLPVVRRAAQILADENVHWQRELPSVWPAALTVRLCAGHSVAWQRRALRAWLASRGVTDADFAQIEAVRGLLTDPKPSRVNLSRDRHCQRRAGRLFIVSPSNHGA